MIASKNKPSPKNIADLRAMQAKI